jgi:hypothetical protein
MFKLFKFSWLLLLAGMAFGQGQFSGGGGGGSGPTTAAGVVALFTACSGTQYLGADGACHNAAGAPSLDQVTGAAAQATITETAALHEITFAGVETAALTAPYVIQNSNSTNNNASISLLVNAAGTDTTPIPLVVNGPVSATNFEIVTGGTVTNGVLSGQTVQFTVAAAGITTVGAGAAGGAGLRFNGDTAGAGIYNPAGATYSLTNGTNEFFRFNTSGAKTISGGGYGMTASSTSSTGAYDTCMGRSAAAVVSFNGDSGCSDTTARLKAAGYISVGTKFTTNNGCTDGTNAGGATAGYFAVGSTSCTEIVTMGNSATAPNGWSCTVVDITTLADVTNPHQTSSSTTTATFVTGTVVSGDKIQFSCIGY